MVFVLLVKVLHKFDLWLWLSQFRASSTFLFVLQGHSESRLVIASHT